MQFIMQQRIVSYDNYFQIHDQTGAFRYSVTDHGLHLGKAVTFSNPAGYTLASVRKSPTTDGTTTYEIFSRGRLIAIVKEDLFTLLNYHFTARDGSEGAGPGEFEIRGDFVQREYMFYLDGKPVAMTSKHWFPNSITFGVNVVEGNDAPLILACTFVVDLITNRPRKIREGFFLRS